ncbi:hypothetical protein EXT46_03895 [Pseudoalteromonas sp. CO325X]|uniref:hypothetical protein n=1 Tax=Pseudoalteromonas sp. CO325X TaxID=1777262 RepID=UPI001022D095|nr:hypothetical protein [Pseudoalteromonas sp. CO325X]RZF84465.1 hypothetical protein EXT46_03895 [Pseudoalteromonas sp. CO325X]
MCKFEYKENFLEAIKLGNQLLPAWSLDADVLGDLIDRIEKSGNQNDYRSLNLKLVEQLKEQFIKNGFVKPANKCLEYSTYAVQLIEDLQDRGRLPGLPFFLTVGNVYYKGEPEPSLASKESIEALIKKGKGVSDVNIHVWLTSFDLSVIDLTLQFSLAAKGKLSGQPGAMVTEPLNKDYIYEPILVNNLFDRAICHGGLTPSWV